jgi:hypothetical protein
MSDKTDKKSQTKGRPKIELDTAVLTKLAEIQCNLREIAYVMGCSVDTLKRNYMDVIEVGQAQGKIKLRRAMFRNATENDHAVMQIFLAKNLLGMQDQPRATDDTDILPWDDGE